MRIRPAVRTKVTQPAAGPFLLGMNLRRQNIFLKGFGLLQTGERLLMEPLGVFGSGDYARVSLWKSQRKRMREREKRRGRQIARERSVLGVGKNVYPDIFSFHKQFHLTFKVTWT